MELVCCGHNLSLTSEFGFHIQCPRKQDVVFNVHVKCKIRFEVAQAAQ